MNNIKNSMFKQQQERCSFYIYSYMLKFLNYNKNRQNKVKI